MKCFEAEELGKEPLSEACQAACLQQNPPAETPEHSRARRLCWVGAEGSLSLCPFAEDGVTVPGGGRADELCSAESREERGGEGAAGGRTAEAAGRDGEGTSAAVLCSALCTAWLPCWFIPKALMSQLLGTAPSDWSCFRLAFPRSRRSGWSAQSLPAGYPRDEHTV